VEEQAMKERMLTIVITLLIIGISTACAMQQKRTYQELKHPGAIDCAHADGDLRMLQHEKAWVGERIVEGVTAIYPASLVVGLVMGTEGTKIRVATGDYNKAIENRIAQIKRTCGIP
jgi:hypothetical protein